MEEYGEESWELDALEPAALSDLVRDEIATLVDTGLWAKRVEEERHGRAALEAIAGNFDEIAEDYAP